MIITDFEKTKNVQTIEEMRALMEQRFSLDGSLVNSFSLCHENGHAELFIWVSNNLASIWYTPNGDNPGFISIGTVANLKTGEDMLFYFYKERQPRPNESVVTFTEALKVAEEFLHSQELPKAIKWLQL